jgi:O-antigen ligase
MSYKPSPMSHQLSAIKYIALCAILIFTPLARGSVQGWAVTTIHMITLVALTAFLVQKSWNRDWKWISTPLDKPILALLILCLVSSAFSMHHRTSLWSMILLINYIVIFYLTIYTINTRTHLRRLIYLIIGIAIFLSVFGLFKRFGVNPFPWWEYSELKYPLSFLSATYGNHNHLAGYLEMAIPLTLGLFLTGYRGGKLSLVIFLTFIMLIALVLSLSRGGWISAFIGLIFMAICLLTSRYFKRKGFLIALIGGSVALIIIILASSPVIERIQTVMEKGEESSLHSRLVIWEGVVEMIEGHPLLGTGPGTFPLIFTQHQPPGLRNRFFMAHNDYLQFTSEVGLLLIPIIIWMIIALYRKGFKKLKNPSRLVRGTTLGAMSGLTAILIHSIVDFNLHIPANALLFAVLIAIVVSPPPQENRSSFHGS